MTAKPISRTFGSKARIAPQLLALVPPGMRIWAEAFAGTASLTLAKEPHPAEHINDLDGAIVGLFRVLRDPPLRDRLIEAVSLTPWAADEFQDCAAAPTTVDQVENARRYLVRCWQGVAGIRVTRTGFAADLHARKARPLIWDSLPERLSAAAARFKQVHVHHLHVAEFVAIFAAADDAVLFVDPPYPRHSINTHDAGYAVDMNDGEHAALAAQLRDVSAQVILTMAPGTIYERVLTDWWRRLIPVRGLRNTIKDELVLTNFDPTARGLFAGPRSVAAS